MAVYSKIRVTKDHGYFRVGEILDVWDIIPDILQPKKVAFLIIPPKNYTIPKENTEWYPPPSK